MLLAVLEHSPEFYPLMHSAYSSPSSLFWSDKTIQLVENVQQGDSLRLLMFCLCIYYMSTQLQSELAFFYLDDGTLGGHIEEL